MEIIIFIIILFIIVLIILHAVIKDAIDSSQTAENIRQIGMILSKGQPEDENSEIENILITECPACGEKITAEDNVCPSCGLALRFDKDDN